jgi:hypothetical protein
MSTDTTETTCTTQEEVTTPLEVTVAVEETIPKRKRGRPKKGTNMGPSESQRQRILAQSQAKKLKTATKPTVPIKIASYADLAATKLAALAKARAKEEHDRAERQKVEEEQTRQERLAIEVEALKATEKLKAKAILQSTNTKWNVGTAGKRPQTAWDLQALMYFLDNKKYHGYEKTADIFGLTEEDLRGMMTYIRAQPSFPENLPKVVWNEEQKKEDKQQQATHPTTSYNVDQVCHATAAHLYHHLTKRYDDRLKRMETTLAIS